MQTIYSIDYLKSISKEKLWKLAKENPVFSLAAMERELNMPKDTARYAIKFKVSKYDEEIKKYLIEFLTSYSFCENNLEKMFLEANKYKKVTFKKIAKDLNSNSTTISENIHGKRKAPTAYQIQKYLENIIEQHKQSEELENSLTYDFNLKQLYDEARRVQYLPLTKIARDLKCSISAVSLAIRGKSTNEIAYKIKEYLESVINKNKDSGELMCEYEYSELEALKSMTSRELYEEARKYATFSLTGMAECTGISYNAIYSAMNSFNSKYADTIKKYLIKFLLNVNENTWSLSELFDEANKYEKVTDASIARELKIPRHIVNYHRRMGTNNRKTAIIKEYLEAVINKHKSIDFTNERKEQNQMSNDLNLEELFYEANNYQKITRKKIAEDLNCDAGNVSSSIKGQTRGKNAYRIKEYLEAIINQYKPLDESIQKMQEQDLAQEETKEQEQMIEETFTEDKEMKTYDNFLNFIDTQKELPIVKKALDETLSENQNLDKILAKEEFITIETAQELNEKLFANEYTEEEILDFENQYFGTTDNDSLKDKIKSFVEKHNLSLETALKLLQISEEDYNKMLEGADKVSNKTADKIYKAISAFDEFYRSEKTQDTINNTKNTFVTGLAIASAKSQTFLNKGLNKFADFLNKSADKIKNSNSENKED